MSPVSCDAYRDRRHASGGKNQVFLTPGIILGRFGIYWRLRLIIGGGCQSAITPRYVGPSEQMPAYDHAWIVTARVAVWTPAMLQLAGVRRYPAGPA